PAHSVLPPLLLPLCSGNQEAITEEEMELLPEECQLLPPSHRQEQDTEVLKLELETLYLLAARGGREGRKVMRDNGTYVVIRELHLQLEHEAIRGWCEKIVDLLLGEEIKGHGEIEVGHSRDREGRVTELADEDDDNEVVPIF
ncbi:MAG: hypothetical protein Q9163_005894, partial [Psora crenata]